MADELKGWTIVVKTDGPDGPTKETFAVAIADRDQAIDAICLRKNITGTVIIVTEATPGALDLVYAEPGKITPLF
jgi:hypothetical protein